MVESTVRSEQSALVLPPGFRFHPTDEEVITSYLLHKFFNPSFTSRAVGEVDLNKCEPWDLPSKAKMGEKEWYFFCHKDMKYPTGMRTNRATKEGYWKATGKDKEIFSNKPSNLLVGMKKTLVFYMGRAPRGSKTNWIMHEFRLEGNSRDSANLRVNPKDEWVVCKVFHKKGEAKTKAAVEHSAGTTPNVSSVDAGDGDDDFLDFMIDPIYFNNCASSLPSRPTINAAPYNADYSISAAPGSTSSSTGSFVDLPNYSLINASNQQFAVAKSVPTSSSSNNSSSWNNMLAAAGPAAHGMGSYSNNVRLHQDGHQAVLVKALGGVIGPDSGVSKGLPSSVVAGVSQQNSLGVPQNNLCSYVHPYSSHLAASTAATTGSADNLDARLVHY